VASNVCQARASPSPRHMMLFNSRNEDAERTCLRTRRVICVRPFMLVLVELFGSPFMKNCNVVIALLFGYFVAGRLATVHPNVSAVNKQYTCRT